jgi:ABC-2 type transport system permease protein
VMIRNPYVISQTALQLVFLIPMILIALRGNFGTDFARTATLAPTASLLMGMAWTTTLTRIVASGEEAPDLLKSSPNHGRRLRQSKLLAVLIPVWVILCPLFLFWIVRGQSRGIELLLFFLATYCCALLRLWNSKPTPLKDLFTKTSKHTGTDVFLSILEVLFVFPWLPIPVFISQGLLFYALFSTAVIAGCMALAYWRSRQLGTSLGF